MALTTSRTSNRSWADFVDEVDVTQSSLPEASSEDKIHSGSLAAHQDKLSELPSAGSASHMSARCKPCAFFHTKGCQNGKDCEFCHLCPPHEKQRRKRLRDRMCETLGQMSIRSGRCMEGQRFHPSVGMYDQVDRGFKTKGGHRRQASGTSTVSTQSGCSGWFSHSRQSSGSSDTLSCTDNTGMVPYYQFAHAMMPTIIADSNSFPIDTSPSDAHDSFAEPNSNIGDDGYDEVVCDDDLAIAMTLPQAVSYPRLENSNCAVPTTPCDRKSTLMTSDRGVSQFSPVAHGSIPPGSNVVLVPIPVPMPIDGQCQPHAVDLNNPYIYSAGPYAQHFPIAAMNESHANWFVQAGVNSAQPNYNCAY